MIGFDSMDDKHPTQVEILHAWNRGSPMMLGWLVNVDTCVCFFGLKLLKDRFA